MRVSVLTPTHVGIWNIMLRANAVPKTAIKHEGSRKLQTMNEVDWGKIVNPYSVRVLVDYYLS